MNQPLVGRRASVKIALYGLLAFALLTIRFSPNWVEFNAGLRDARIESAPPAQRAALRRAILSSYSARGYYVLEQAHHLNAEIDDPRHKIVRWRLLVPVLGDAFRLPDWLVLGLAQVGCIGLVLALVAIGCRHLPPAAGPDYEPLCLGIVAGASAPFFTSMGLLGYYDSWLALAFLAVAFARSRWIVGLACLLAPWIDERFLLGLPLTLGVRWLLADGAAVPFWRWCRDQAAIPVVLAVGYGLIRLHLGGTEGSQTVREYLNQFVFADPLSLPQRLVGAGAGLRIGWILVIAAIVGSGGGAAGASPRKGLLLGLGVVVTAALGLWTALDLGRSMVLLLAVVPFGWMLGIRTALWRQVWAGPLLAAAALILPASHVVGKFSRAVDNLWSPPRALLTAENALGLLYGTGDGVPRDGAEAVHWYRKAAELGNPEAQYNLGVMYAHGDGIRRDPAASILWWRRAADQDFALAQYNLGMTYAEGTGVPRDGAAAATWLRRAAQQGNPAAQYNLGVLYASGSGVPQDYTAAAQWYRRAAAQDYAEAENNLGILYVAGHGLPQDYVQACSWLLCASAQGSAGAKKNLAILQGLMVPEQLAAAAQLAQGRQGPPVPVRAGRREAVAGGD